MDNILIQAVAAAMFVKILVDAVNMTGARTRGGYVLLLAFAFGQVAAFMLEMAVGDGLQLTQKDISTCFLVGVAAVGQAVLATELQKKAEERKAS